MAKPLRYFRFLTAAIVSFIAIDATAQNVLGLDGGFEGSATVDNTTTYTAGQSGKWAKASTNQTIASETTTVRTGSKSAKISNTSTATGQRFYTPTFTVVSGTQYVVQYYRLVTNTTNAQHSYLKLSLNGTTGTEASVGTYGNVSAANTWEKVFYAPASTPTVTTTWAAVMHKAIGTGGDMYIDDFAVYAAPSVDNSAPNTPGVIVVDGATTSSLDLVWSAASGGEDGGGYMLVRYTSNPAAADDPLVNGVYKTTNTVAGTVTGTVVYLGTGTSFTDAGLSASTSYYYKLYTYDKAYNYSPEQTVTGLTAGSYSGLSDIFDNTNYSSTTPEFNINPSYISYANGTSTTTGKTIPMKLKLRDGGSALSDADAFSTILKQVKFTVKNPSGTNRVAYIKTAILTTSTGTVLSTASVVGTELVFTAVSGSSLVVAPDNNETIFHLRVSFDETQVTDNEKLIYKVSGASVNTAGSSFAAADAGGAQSDINTSGGSADRNQIEAAATALAFVQQPGNIGVNVAMTPSVTVKAIDANNVTDLDYASSVSIISTGTLSSSPQTATASSGIATFSNITHTAGGTSLTLSASSGSLTSTTSNSFNITSTLIFRSKQTGDWNTLSTWESSSNGGSSWSNATTVPEYTQGAITIQSPHVVTITASLSGSNRVDEVTVNSGGNLVLNNSVLLQLNNAPGGADLKVLGTLTDRSTNPNGLNNASGDGTWELGTTGTYIKEGNSSSVAWKDSYEGGILNIPATSNWVVRQTAASVFSMSSTDMYYGNLTIENTSGSAWSTTLGQTFLGSSSSPVIKGNLDVGGTGANAVNFVNANTAVTPVLVKGNLTVRSGSALNLGTSSESCSGVTVYGNVQIDGSLAFGTSGNRTLYLQSGATQSFSGAGTISLYNFEISGVTTVTLGKTITVTNGMTITDNSLLNLQGFNLNVVGRWAGGSAVASNVTGTGSVILNGSSLQQLSGKTNFKTLRLNNSAGAQMQAGASYGIYTALELQAGTFAVNGQTLTCYSQAVNSYAYINNFTSGFTGTLTGNVVAQLTVPTSGRNQHFIGAPLAATFSQFNATGTSGYVLPFYASGYCSEARHASGSPYGTVFSWEEDKPLTAPGGSCPLYGWNVQTSGSPVAGQGYSVYLYGGTFSLTGSPNFTSPVTVTGLANTGYSLGTLQNPNTSTYTSGWHLLANPYLSPYDMLSSMQAVPNNGNFDDLMVWVASGKFSGTYQSLISGGFNGNMLAPFQGVMIHRGNGGAASTPQTAASFQFNKTYQTVAGTLPQFTRQTSQGALKIEIAGNGFEDITYVEFKDNTTSNFDIGHDSRKMVSALGQPTIYTLLNGEFMSSNVNRSIEEVSTIPLNVAAGADGTFTFTFDGIGSFDPTSYVYLEDKVTGAYQNLRSSNTYTFSMNQIDNHDRFVLHFSPAAEINTTDATCNTTGMINVEQPGSANWNYTLIDNNGFAIASGTLNESAPLTQSVAVGVYTLTLTDTSGYEVVQTIQISGLQPIAAVFSAAHAAEVDETISFTSSTPNAVSYSWDFGDGSFYNDLVPTTNHQYTEEGVYTVSLSVTNQDGCSSTATQIITITAKTVSGINDAADENSISMWSNGSKVYIDFSSLKNPNASVDIHNILGQQLSHETFNRSGVYSKTILNMESGYVIVRVKNDEEVTTRKLLISNK